MTHEDIIRMAREAEINKYCDGIWCTADQLERFAALVAAAEREACARLVETTNDYGDGVGCWFDSIAADIRARGDA